MPAIYAHYKMGEKVKIELNNRNLTQIKNIIDQYPELFYIGLHGPDILFFYHALIPNRINKLGHDIHSMPGKDFFQTAAKALKSNPNSAHFAYAYGVLCHFALDLSCHGYIADKIAASGVSHTEIETEFDGSLMMADGLDPIRHITTGHLHGTKENAETIKAFYPGTTATQIKRSIKEMIFITNFLITPSEIKRSAIFTGMKLVGLYRGGHGLVVNKTPNPLCADSNNELKNRLDKSVPLAIDLIDQFHKYTLDEGPLDGDFLMNFSSQL